LRLAGCSCKAARLRRLSAYAIYEELPLTVVHERFVEKYLSVHTADAERAEIALF
jgi:hypothetical protein